MKKYSLAALAAAGLLAGGLSVSSASAADLGGNCCADLEERVAELEATTARKGNRKVSLTISGWVAQQVTWWDDGSESNVYVSDIGTTLASHFKLTGQATIAPGWYAGYVLHIEVNGNDPFFFSQNTDEGSGVNLPDAKAGVVNPFQSFWFIKSDHLGKLSVGRQSMASDNAAILVDGSGSLVPANWVLFDGKSFNLKVNGANFGGTWGGTLGRCLTSGDGIGADCAGVPADSVRYDSPVFAGFSVSAGWGEDDIWDVAARYAGEFNGFKLAAAASYTENTNTEGPGAWYIPNGPGGTTKYFQVGGYVEHVPTGLWAYGAWGHEEWEGPGFPGVTFRPDNDHWYVKAGLRERWTPLGHTVIFGEYGTMEDMSDLIGTNNVTGTEMRRYGVGLVQEIDAAAMSLWLVYRHHEGELDCGGAAAGNSCGANATGLDFDDFDLVKAGALINF